MTLTDLKSSWQDTPEYHTHIHELFCENVNNDEQLNAHRTFIEQNVYGMGERSFQWFWKLMVDEMPNRFTFLEIGVHKAQVVSLIALLGKRTNKTSIVYGITPMNGDGTGWREDDYEGDIAKIHEHFKLNQPVLYKGYSQEPEAVDFALNGGHRVFGWTKNNYDCIYIDGSHTYNDALFDLRAYGGMVKQGGYLVIDDAACRTHQNFGVFQGIDTVCTALAEFEATDFGKEFIFQFNVVHLMVYKRK